MRPFLPIVAVVFVAACAALGCDRAPSPAGLKEWQPGDHDGENRSSRIAAANQGARVAGGDAGGIPMLVDLAWKNQCQSCHGAAGHGDGPQGSMFKAADLGREEWQSKVRDEEIAATILSGKGRMPKFELPEEIVNGLVGRIRSFRGK
jgi:mono/diheme cytochrome c family protein